MLNRHHGRSASIEKTLHGTIAQIPQAGKGKGTVTLQANQYRLLRTPLDLPLVEPRGNHQTAPCLEGGTKGGLCRHGLRFGIDALSPIFGSLAQDGIRSMTPKEIRESLQVSKQGAMDLLNPLLEAKLVQHSGTQKSGHYKADLRTCFSGLFGSFGSMAERNEINQTNKTNPFCAFPASRALLAP